jgi:3-oxoacyl-[acyl-carrier-protein] synthase II
MSSRDGKQIVISGLGVVTPIGASVEEFWASNLTGRSGIRTEDRMDLSELPCGWMAGLIPEQDKKAVRARWGADGRSWGDCLLHAAVDQAISDARLGEAPDGPAGLVWARVWPGPSGSEPADYVRHFADLAGRYQTLGDDPVAVARYLRDKPLPLETVDLSRFPAELAETLGVPLIATRLEATCAGGLRAIAEAARLLHSGKVSMAIVAASVSRNTPYVLSQYGQLMALSRWTGPPEQASMPFDRRRSGMVINESAGALVLETAAHAASRGLDQVYGRVAGWGLAVGTDHMTAPNVSAVERVMRTALDQAGVQPGSVDTVNAHGTSTKLNDVTEARAMHRLFGERMADLPVCAVKSLTGHGSAASGVVETAVAALTMCSGIIPPVVTCTEPDPACGVSTSLTPVEMPVRRVLKNSFGFGGQYASMVFERADNPRIIPPVAMTDA